MLIEIPNVLDARAGDRVEISIPEKALLKMSFVVYMIPVIALIAGACFGEILAEHSRMDTSLISFIGGILCMGLAFYLIRYLDRNGYITSQYSICMTRIINAESSLPEPCDSI